MSEKWVRATLIITALMTSPLLCADTIAVTFSAGTLIGTPGNILTFEGTITNTSGADVFINGAGITLAGFGPSDTDATDFILNTTGLLGMGASIGPTNFFTVTIPSQFATGQYPGVFAVQGGPTVSDDTVLGTVPFQVNVNAPEPSTFSLSITALLVTFFSWRRVCRR